MTNPAEQTPTATGALVSISATGGIRTIAFQYNPDTLRRTIQPNTVGGTQGARSEAVRFAGAPEETISLDCRFSAADALDAGDPLAQEYGIAPQLAALALLAYPRSSAVTQAQAMLDAGSIEVLPQLADRLLFVWGAQRVIPCRIDSFSITEQIYDSNLSPILALVSLSLRVLSYSDVDASNPAYQEFVAYQQSLERLADLAAPESGG